ncbi:hypothetical protein [Streptomyces griseocarneus]|uniref:hypothetical protein n=1 Tax=Streptomyces griseocarneus TaxID=51201 RepID=UPI00167E7942|nr:hypothetical protein [Streptomyces griseocarneus]MBZ6476757.1 hypothetical protein [Streptomyces griseocarneus]GHG80754.1 hypothetical protein GCM10018779_62590 [Streptomyces griseocarneus]
MTTAPNVTVKDSSQLAEGDIVLTYGMRVWLDTRTTRTDSGYTVYAWSGTVRNLDEVREEGHVPMPWLRTWKNGLVDREDAWTIQGNTFANWLVENPS